MEIKSLKNIIRTFMGKRVWYYFGTILCTGIFNSAFHIMVSLTIGALCTMAEQGTGEGLRELLLRNLAVSGACAALCVGATVAYNNEAKRCEKTIRNKVYTKMLRLPFAYYDTHHSGEMMSRILYDASRTGDIFGSRLRRVVSPILAVIVCMIPMFYLCPQVMTGLLLINCLSLGANMLLVKPTARIAGQASHANEDMTEGLSNLMQGMEVVRMFEMKCKVREKFQGANHHLAKLNGKSALIQALLSALNCAFDLLSSLIFLALGVWYIGKNVADVSSLVSLYLLYGTFSWNFLQIGQYIPDLAGCIVNGKRILEYLSWEEEPETYVQCQGRGAKNREKGYIDFAGITFGYADKAEKVLRNFSIGFEAGKCTAITGKSGAGKSTLLKLLLGLYPAESGCISVANISLQDMGLKALREKLAYVPQEPYLYHVSVAENIRYGKPDATIEEIVRAAKAAYAHDFIIGLENGYETLVGERGNSLSGGQRQRIAIARAILRNAPILLMDEATSALDNESEYLVQEAIKALRGNRTVLIIAHRQSTIEAADVVVEI